MIEFGVARAEEQELIRGFYRVCGYRGGLNDSDVTVVARDEGRIVGAVRLCPAGEHVVMRGLQILPSYKRRAVGRSLLYASTKEIADLDCYCLPWSHQERFYGQIGFKKVDGENVPDSVRRGWDEYRKRSLDVIIMRRPKGTLTAAEEPPIIDTVS